MSGFDYGRTWQQRAEMSMIEKAILMKIGPRLEKAAWRWLMSLEVIMLIKNNSNDENMALSIDVMWLAMMRSQG